MIDSCWGSGVVCISRSFWLFRRRLQPTVAPQINHATVLMEVSIGWAGGWDGFLLVGTVCWETHNPVTGQCQCWTFELLTQDCVAQRRRDSDLWKMTASAAARFQLWALASSAHAACFGFCEYKTTGCSSAVGWTCQEATMSSAPRTVTLCGALGPITALCFFLYSGILVE